ncbi:MAG: ABC transporter ATP-binding protein [Candidatus Palauibacterales bacterium]|nr:ABC transporter ATP-binding protein [Candidatus Palauibacterales bacterium]
MQTSPEVDFHEEEALGKAYDSRLMKRLLRYLRPYRWQVVAAVIMLILASGLELVGPYLTAVAIDKAIPAGDLRLITVLATIYAVALAVALLLSYLQTLLATWIGQKVMYDLRTEIFAHLQRLSLRFFDRNPVGRLMTRMTSDVEVLNEMFTSGVVAIFGDVFTLLFIVGVMLAMNWKLALVSFTVLPLVWIVAMIFRLKVRRAYRDIRVKLARINAFLQERITGMSTVQLFGQEEREAKKFHNINFDHLYAHLRSITYYALFFPVIEILSAIALALIIWYGGLRVLDGTVTVGVVAAFLQYARRFYRPIQDLSEKYNVLQGAMASSERIFKLLDTDSLVADRETTRPLPSPVRGRIEFRNVWFAYNKAGFRDDGRLPDWVLKDVSLKVEPGERLAIVGHTGAGKTTIINLLMRFYDPQRGTILLDDIDIREFPQRELRSAIGLVLQDVYLFSGNARYNVRLGNEEISDDDIVEAARRVGADRFVRRLPDGYEQELGERGASLSVGERQLLSFARALAYNPCVLVLDEATSSVDSEIEARIQEAVEELMRGRTSLVIAHRLSTVQNASKILVLHGGEVQESGTHEELLERGELYARLYELQFVGDAPSAA